MKTSLYAASAATQQLQQQQFEALTVSELIGALQRLNRPNSLACVVVGGDRAQQDGRMGLVYKLIAVTDADLVVIAGDPS